MTGGTRPPVTSQLREFRLVSLENDLELLTNGAGSDALPASALCGDGIVPLTMYMEEMATVDDAEQRLTLAREMGGRLRQARNQTELVLGVRDVIRLHRGVRRAPAHE